MTRELQEPSADQRTDPPYVADERTSLEAWLDYHRATLLWKCDGLTPQQLAERSAEPSTMSLLGLVRHMARVENSWFQRVAQANGLDRIYWSAEDDDLDFNAAEETQECVDDAFASWRREVGAAEEWFAGVPESDLGRELPIAGVRRDVVSIRDLVVHMIEEYARHCGHADLVRECIDGRAGQ